MAGEHLDVLIVGAGISGIGAACRLRESCPGKTFAILEARGAIGGTWDLFRFPGIRSDSDMFTLSYPFRPWTGSQAIVDGPGILNYVRETATEYGVQGAIRFHHRVIAAEWSSAEACWTVEAHRSDTDETVLLTCGFLFSCTGYFRYDEGYTPDFEDVEQFRGEIVHPQFWNEDLDHSGKRVVVIGSGATAVTLVPALAERAAHVTMLQRSPSYIIALPATDPLAGLLGRHLPARLAYQIVRWKNVMMMVGIYTLSQRRPGAMRWLLRKQQEHALPPGYDIDTHFNPHYGPWDQRLCLASDGDLFEAICDGRVSMVTDQIDRFTETGLRLRSGTELEADLIVTATGLKLLPIGGIRLTVDADEVQLPESLVYRGMMLTGVPNMAFAFGYINESWTLGSDLACEHVCRLLGHMDRHGYTYCTPRKHAPASTVPFMELTSGYVLRSIDQFPRQARSDPWRRRQNYALDSRSVRRAPLDDPALEFSRAAPAPRATETVAA